jgi:hypothetical protein
MHRNIHPCRILKMCLIKYPYTRASHHSTRQSTRARHPRREPSIRDAYLDNTSPYTTPCAAYSPPWMTTLSSSSPPSRLTPPSPSFTPSSSQMNPRACVAHWRQTRHPSDAIRSMRVVRVPGFRPVETASKAPLSLCAVVRIAPRACDAVSPSPTPRTRASTHCVRPRARASVDFNSSRRACERSRARRRGPWDGSGMSRKRPRYARARDAMRCDARVGCGSDGYVVCAALWGW